MEKKLLILLAGGIGSRFGSDIPKQFVKVDGKSMINHCIDSILEAAVIDHIQVVVDKTLPYYEDLKAYLENVCGKVSYGISSPGLTRSFSIRNALADIDGDEKDIVIIHDAARPLVSTRLLHSLIVTLQDAEGAMPVIRPKDSTYYLEDDGLTIKAGVDRDRLVMGQTPEAFCLGSFKRGVLSLSDDELIKLNGTSEIALELGIKVKVVEGEEDNFKVTQKADLEKLSEILARRRLKDGDRA